MGIFDKVKGPVFLKEDSSAEKQLIALQELAGKVSGKLADQIEQEIRNVEAGIVGEKNILYELRNSHIPMFVIRDLYLECDGLSAQIDFLIFTRVHNYVVECKNLYGDIEVTSTGDFIRTTNFGKIFKKEGIYSPITQNKRHLELIKQIRGAEKSNILVKALFEKGFYDNYRSIVVLANPKTVLNVKYAKKEVKEKVIRADQLVEMIRKIDADPNSAAMSEKATEALAQFFLGIHKEVPVDYTARFRIEPEKEEKTVKSPTDNIIQRRIADSTPAAAIANAAVEKQVADVQAVTIKPAEAFKSSVIDEPAIVTESATAIHTPITEHTAVINEPVPMVSAAPDSTSADAEHTESVICPKCGAVMIRRKATKGANAGKEFYGCSNYPHCRGLIPIE
jgi:predicted RNA-binding Zn-ribbon protein involved in translation (DUF1610 family)